MITAKEARQLMENAKEEKRKVASAYFFSQFKNFESQIENRAKAGNDHIALRFQDRNSLYEVDKEIREDIVRKYYESLGYTVEFNPEVGSIFSLHW